MFPPRIPAIFTPSVTDFINQIMINAGSQLPYLPQSLHYPNRIIACFGVALGKITSASHLYKMFGKNWQKRLNVDDVKKFLSLISIEKYTPLRKLVLLYFFFMSGTK